MLCELRNGVWCCSRVNSPSHSHSCVQVLAHSDAVLLEELAVHALRFEGSEEREGHRNLLHLYGAITCQRPMALVYERASFGDLRQFLQVNVGDRSDTGLRSQCVWRASFIMRP